VEQGDYNTFPFFYSHFTVVRYGTNGEKIRSSSMEVFSIQIAGTKLFVMKGTWKKMGTLTFLASLAICIALLCVGITFGTDAFFAFVGRKSLALSSEGAVVDVMGHIHEVADARMPVVGVLGIGATLAFLLLAGLGTTTSTLGIGALLAQLLFLVLYNVYSKPINLKLRRAARSGEVPEDTRQLQTRWDRVVIIRALVLLIAMLCIAIATIIV